MKHDKDKLNKLVDEVFGKHSAYTGGLRDLVSGIIGEDLREKPPERTYRIGQKFHYNGSVFQGDYILAETFGPGKVVAVNLATGRVRRKPFVSVRDVHAITESEFQRVFRVGPDDRYKLTDLK